MEDVIDQILYHLKLKLHTLCYNFHVLYGLGHINNLYNTCFWNLVNVSGLERKAAKEKLHVSNNCCKLVILVNKGACHR